MVAKSSKARPKDGTAAKTKAKRAASKPLLTRSAEVRRAKTTPRRRVAAVALVPLSATPALTWFNVIGRVMHAYWELPSRLAQCRTPVDVWNAQAAFTRRILGA